MNLSEQQIRESFGVPQNPGAGGWPTVRHFNQETGYGGAPYEKLTSDAMCDELGNIDNMRKYVEDYGAKICVIATGGAYCSESQVKYAEEWKSKDATEVVSQLKRLEGMKGGKMKPDLLDWVKKRIAVLKQYPFAPPEDKECQDQECQDQESQDKEL